MIHENGLRHMQCDGLRLVVVVGLQFVVFVFGDGFCNGGGGGLVCDVGLRRWLGVAVRKKKKKGKFQISFQSSNFAFVYFSP